MTGPPDHRTPLGRALAADAGLRKALLARAARQMATAHDVEHLVQQALAAALESEAVEDLAAAGELEALAKKPIAELDESIRQGGHDPAEADAILERVLAERLAAATPPSANEAPAPPRSRRSMEPPPPSKVLDLTQARTKRRPLAPWLLAAAMLLVIIDVALTHKDAIVPYFTPAQPPAPSVLAPAPSAPPVKKAGADTAEAAAAASSDWAPPGDSPPPPPRKTGPERKDAAASPE